VLFLLATAYSSAAGPRDGLWKQVDEAIEKGLPRTAITVLDQIIPGAVQDQAYAEATKAICQKIALEGQIQGGKPEEKIVRLEAEIAEAPDPMKPVMETILAHWYWQYFQHNRWRFMERTQTAEPPGADITTWDLPRIMAEIDWHFTLALDAAQQLKATPIDEYEATDQPSTISWPMRRCRSTAQASRPESNRRTPLSSWPRAPYLPPRPSSLPGSPRPRTPNPPS
jgi:hypothetical protein